VQWVICYDVADDRRRARLVEVLKDYGERIQESVFVVFEEQVEGLMERAGRIVEGEDRLHGFGICEGCWRGMRVLGAAKRPEAPGFYVV